MTNDTEPDGDVTVGILADTFVRYVTIVYYLL